MLEILSEVYYLEQRLSYIKTIGRNTFYYTVDNKKISHKEIKENKAIFICHKCDAEKDLFIYRAILLKPYCCQSCNKRGQLNGFYGKKHTEEFKQKLSDERSGSWGVGDNNPMKGRHIKEFMDDENYTKWVDKMRILALNNTNNPFRNIKEYMGEEKWLEVVEKRKNTINNRSIEEKEKYSKSISASQKELYLKNPEKYIEDRRRAGVESVKSQIFRKNKIEKKVEEYCNSRGVELIYSPIMGDGKNNYQFDFKVIGKRIIIECHGEYWHGDERFYNNNGEGGLKKLNEVQIKKIEADDKKKKYLEDRDFQLLIIWEREINEDNFSSLDSLFLI